MKSKSFRGVVLRALLILLWDVQQRHWPSRVVQLVGPESVTGARSDILVYIEENAL